MAIWLDFSGRFPGVAALKAVRIHGEPVEGLLRYIGLGSEGKQIHRAEHDAIIAAGFRLGLVAELGTGDAWAELDDYGTGRARAQIALDDMHREAPRAEFICCAADAHASSQAQIRDAVQYAGGFQSVLGYQLSGFYGFSETSRAVRGAGLCRAHWRCGSRPSTEDQKWVNFWQRNDGTVVVNGTTCDINETYAPLSGQEDDMPTADEIWLAKIEDPHTADPANPGHGMLNTAKDVLYEANGAAWRAEALAQKALDELAELKARPPADVDEAALATELAARGIGGVSAAELIEILSGVRLAPARTEGSTTA